MKTPPATARRFRLEPKRRPASWRRVVAALCAAAVAAAFALPAEAAAAPLHAHHAAASPAHAAHPTRDCGGGITHHAAAAGHHPQAPGAPHAHHTACRDCCCASPGAQLPRAWQAPLLTPCAPSPAVLAAADAPPSAPADFLHPFPNGPPTLRD